MMKRLGMIGCAAAAMMAQAASAQTADEVQKRQARDALELFYLDRSIYDPVRCRVEDGGEPERTWVRCTAALSDGSIGGLYMIGKSEEGDILIFAVNGKAIQHIQNDPIQIEDMRQNSISVSRWMGDPLDIMSANSLFN